MNQKLRILLLFSILSSTTFAQNSEDGDWNYKNFETKFLTYNPIQTEGVSEKDFSDGQMIVSETKRKVASKPENFTYTDYWNITTAFYSLNEKKEIWEISLKKIAESSKGCGLLSSTKEQARFYNNSKELYESLLKTCALFPQESDKFDFSDYISKNQLNKDLVSLIRMIDEDDQRFRHLNNMKKQQPLDEKVQILIDSLFQSHGTYIGKSLVGTNMTMSCFSLYNIQMWR